MNRVHCLSESREETIKGNARTLARKLQHDNPQTFGLLQCKGYVLPYPKVTEAVTLVFRPPEDLSTPRSLRELLVNPPTISLSQRIAIAKDLAKAVGYVHTFGFVHKNVRPESFVVFSAPSNALSGFLLGFEDFRQYEGWTGRAGDAGPEKNLYRHPSRQGTFPGEDFTMQHDIYSLGVCMLEIGIWASFAAKDYLSNWHPLDTALLEFPASIADRTNPVFTAPASIADHTVSDFLIQSGKAHLVSLAQSQLPARMGDQYTEIVTTCLTCLDPDNEDFGDSGEFLDEDGIRVGARYIEKVCLDVRNASYSRC